MKIEKEQLTLYWCVHSKLLESADVDKTIGHPEALFILGCLYHIPKDRRRKVIKELHEFGFIEQINKRKILIKDF